MTIVFDEFKKVEIKIGKIISAERVEGSEKLIKLAERARLYEKYVDLNIDVSKSNNLEEAVTEISKNINESIIQ